MSKEAYEIIDNLESRISDLEVGFKALTDNYETKPLKLYTSNEAMVEYWRKMYPGVEVVAPRYITNNYDPYNLDTEETEEE